jgi:hypothetical protein
MEEIINRVKNSKIITLDLSDFLPKKEIVSIDIEKQLWQGLVLKESDFRLYIKEENWSNYANKFVHIWCSADAIVPTWAYMLVASALRSYTDDIYFGTQNEAIIQSIHKQIDALDLTSFEDSRVVIKGCADVPSPEAIFLHLTVKLQPVVKALMYGEPCSTVPVFKAPKI